ncbi:MAG: SPOR domain-containing protein [Bacteroidetes bacterium]|nr:SPOR domain-containing protein [Bacteroidota bacterium]
MQKRLIYSFEKKALIRILVGSCVLGILIFVAGVLIGYQMGLGGTHEVITADTTQQIDTVKKRVKLPPAMPDSMVNVYHYVQNSFEVEKDSMIYMGISKLRPTYCVQLGAFTDNQRALNRIEELKEKGLTAYIFESKSSKGTQWYCVRIGKFTDKKEADRAAYQSEIKYKVQSLSRPYNVF